MAVAEVRETVLFLPQDIVQKSVGFSLDVGKIEGVLKLVNFGCFVSSMCGTLPL